MNIQKKKNPSVLPLLLWDELVVPSKTQFLILPLSYLKEAAAAAEETLSIALCETNS